MYKFIKTFTLFTIFCLTGSLANAQTQEIELIFDTSGYGTSDEGTPGIIAPSTQGSSNDTLPSIKGEANVNSLGGLNYTLPIDVVQGVNDFSPNIALTYNSQSQNGVAGYGWNISGLSSITLGGKSKEIDGITIGAQFDGKDPFYLDGGRLLTTDGKNFTTYLYSKIKIEKLTTGQYSFIVKYPNGKVAKYKEIHPGTHMISTMSDAFDNQIKYTYEVLNGNIYLKGIAYGGTSETASKYFINLNYIARKSLQFKYLNGSRLVQNKILKSIDITSPENRTNMYRKYVLDYDYIQENTLERLRQVDVFNESGEKLPPLKFGYTNKSRFGSVYKTTTTINRPHDIKEFGEAAFGDFLGNGELMPVYEIVRPNGDKFKLWSSEKGEIASYKKSRDLYAGKILSNKTINGKTEKVISDKDILISIDTDYSKDSNYDILTFDFFDLSLNNKRLKTVKLNLPESTVTVPITDGRNTYYKLRREGRNRKVMIGDFNNDGLIDLLIFQAAGTYTQQSFYFYEIGKNIGNIFDGQNITPISIQLSSVFSMEKNATMYLVEFDGDGIPELLKVDIHGKVNLYKFNADKNQLTEINLNLLGVNELMDFTRDTPLIFGDFNGDGLTDFMTPVKMYSVEETKTEDLLEKMANEKQYWWLYTATGKTFQKEKLDFSDNNLAYIKPSQKSEYKKYNSWDKIWSGKRDKYQYTEYAASNIVAMDINGDGKTDLVSFRKYGKIKYEEGEKLMLSAIEDNTINRTPYGMGMGMQFHIVVPKNSGGFDLKTLYESVNLNNEKISPLSLLYSKTDYNTLNAYKSGLIIHDPLTRVEHTYTISLDDFVEGQLKKIDNGSGVVQEFEYSPLSEAKYDAEKVYTFSPLNLPYPYFAHKANGTHYLVHKMHTLFNDKILSKEYRYHNAVQHLEGKGLLGFQKTKTSEVYESILQNGKYTIKNAERGLFWNTYTYDPEMDNALLNEKFGSFDETTLFNSSIYANEKKVKPNKSYLVLQTLRQNKDELNGFETLKFNYFNDDFLLKNSITFYDDNNSEEEKFTYLPEFTSGESYFYGKIGKVETILKRDGHTFSTKEEFTYTPKGAVATLKKYGNGTQPLTTSYTYYPFGGIKEEKLSFRQGLISGEIWDGGIAVPVEGTGGIHETETNPIGGFPGGPITSLPLTELITKYEYDSSKRFVVKTIAPDGLISTSNVDAYGKVLSQTNGLGLTTSFKYDSWGNLHTVVDYLGKSTKTKKTKSKFDGARYDVTISGADGSSTVTSYDVLDRPVQTKTKSLSKILNVLDPPVFVQNSVIVGPASLDYWSVTRQEYDSYGNVIKNSQPFLEGETPKWNHTLYDRLNRPIEVIDYTGKSIKTCYEKNKITVEDGHKKTAKWVDAQGLVTKSQDQGGIINYTYYANGSLKEADYEGIKTKMSIDGWGNKTKLEDPSAGTYLYAYDMLGRLIRTTNPKGGKTTYTYNKFGQMTAEKTVSSAEDTNINIAYTYDNQSKLPVLVSGSYNGNTFAYSTVYDQYYRIKETKEETPAFTYTNSFAYDAWGRVEKAELKTTLKSSGITSKSIVQNQYSNGILHKQLDENDKQIWKLDRLTAFGANKQITYGNGYKIVNTYDSNDYLQNIKHSKDSHTVVDIDYSYNAQRGTLTERNNKIFNKSEQFVYDDLDRLITEKLRGTVVNQYTYDFRGRTTSNGEIGKYNYNSTNYRLQSVNFNDKGVQMLANRGLATVDYNAFKSPNEIFLENKERINYEFSILKNRYVSYFGSAETKGSQPIKKYYSADKAVEILVENDKTKIITYITGDPYTANYIKIDNYKGNVLQSAKNYYLHRDNLQSIVAVTDSEGNNVEQRYFDAWGNLKAAKIGGANKTVDNMGWRSGLLIDRGYTGHEHLYTVGLIHMNGRVYDPLLRRFMSPDNYVQDVNNTQNYNRYGYVLNNPLLYTDPSGEFIVSALIGVAVGIVANGIVNSFNDVPFFYGAGKAGVMGGIGGAISFGIGSVSTYFGNAAFVAQAGMHGISGGIMSEIEGGKFISGLASGAVSSLVGSAVSSTGNIKMKGGGLFKDSPYFAATMYATGGLSGGLSSSIAGGNFWSGMRQGVITTGLNHLMHMVRDDLWEIRNGKARLINTDDDEIQILSQNKIHLLSDFNFSNDLDAAKTIVDYYSSEYQLSIYNGGTFSLDPQNFISKQAMYNAGLTENTLMSVTLTYNSSSVDINSKFYLLRGRFHQVLDNKYNFINSIGHEYKHYLDNLGFKSKFNNGFRGMQSISGSRAELRAINYQQKLPSWDSTTSNYRRSVELYKSKQL